MKAGWRILSTFGMLWIIVFEKRKDSGRPACANNRLFYMHSNFRLSLFECSCALGEYFSSLIVTVIHSFQSICLGNVSACSC